MTFKEFAQPDLLQASLGKGTVTVLGAQGLRLQGLNSFHLDEGPDFLWLNIYRTLANGRQLEVSRERPPARVGLVDGGVEVHWAPCAEVGGALSARYNLVPGLDAVEVTFAFSADRSYQNFELFIANYFTPYYQPYYPVRDNRTHPEGIFWYQKQWFNAGENESWARDEAAEAVFADGRWTTGHALNWRRGPFYALPLTVQEHRFGHGIVLMAQRRDCFGLSGYNSYHNSQYFHLGGTDIAAGDQVAFTMRMVLLSGWDDLAEAALAAWHQWQGE